MSSYLRSESTLENARRIVTYVLREPVKDAVREALREEGLGHTNSPQVGEDSTGGSGPSKLLIATIVLSIGGLVYFGRKRMSEADPLSSSDSFDRKQSEQQSHRSSGSDIGSDEASTSGIGDS